MAPVAPAVTAPAKTIIAILARILTTLVIAILFIFYLVIPHLPERLDLRSLAHDKELFCASLENPNAQNSSSFIESCKL
ncbi:hypothetical protein A3A39_01785 [Candidatus Kaiserbacteria bacterium RIFCSPLOWO2_01_FULL_54_13]|uniref:Uncharacterized protein n=1 Tax=Candidatus Kaiserbacteria bacterium RIFCSPLOWO2_01_FULL_54_13 TaxID=1798512 RepID=A0A1F6F1G1_9BACT|nr:MAG: hypothetical protein A3A39_01785 [Candidatus Kaiserbacteria bacterium RIFCSPLOWO2_01_FULL_54_13]